MRAFFIIFLAAKSLLAHQPFDTPLSEDSDRQGWIEQCVNVIHGDYSESVIDLIVAGPEPLILQRHYHATRGVIGWSIFPQQFLVIGKDPQGRSMRSDHQELAWSYAFAGEKSGGVLTYSGWRTAEGLSPEGMKIDMIQGAGLVNTYAKEISGHTNHQNHLLYCGNDSSQIVLGDGTLRRYEKAPPLPLPTSGQRVLEEEMIPLLAAKIVEPEYWRLKSERLPSGHVVLFSYDGQGHLASIEMKNATQTKTLSWIHITYQFSNAHGEVKFETSDEKGVEYDFRLERSGDDNTCLLTHVRGRHLIPCTYEYEKRGSSCQLVKRIFPGGRERVIEYDSNGKVSVLKESDPDSGRAEPLNIFHYRDHETWVFNALGHKTCYQFNSLLRLIAIYSYNRRGGLYRMQRKFWGDSSSNGNLLLAEAIEQGNGVVHSYRSFEYDSRGNVVEETLYGNLTGKEAVPLQLDRQGKILASDAYERSRQTFLYSEDGLNLPIEIRETQHRTLICHYVQKTNLLKKQFIYDQGQIKKRTFYEYNADGACTSVMEDDGNGEESDLESGVTERHLLLIQPKETLPHVGFPEVIEKKAFDLKNKSEILIQKFVNSYDSQGNLISSETYDGNGQFVCREEKIYNDLGLLLTTVGRCRKTVHYTYDASGNRTGLSEGERTTLYRYDVRNRLTEVEEMAGSLRFSSFHRYDRLGRVTRLTDPCGNTTDYEYDEEDRLIKVIYPEVLNEKGKPIRPLFSYTYDSFGNLTRITDPKGFVTRKTYNLRGQPTKMTYPDGTDEHFRYDEEGTMHCWINRENIETLYRYDSFGREIFSLRSTAGEQGERYSLGQTTHQYNGFRCISSEQGDLVKEYTFDPVGRVIKITERPAIQKANHEESRCIEFAYDPCGRMAYKKTWFGRGSQDYCLECFDYNLLGDLTEKRIEHPEANILFCKGFSYSRAGDCLEEFGYQKGWKLSLIKTSYNPFGEPTHFLDALGEETRVNIDYQRNNALGKKTCYKTCVDPLEFQTEMEFDGLQRVVMVTQKDPMGLPLSSRNIGYDAAGNQALDIRRQFYQGKLIASIAIRRRFGALGRLEEEEQENGKRVIYTYNSLGQLSEKRSECGFLRYTYGVLGKLERITEVDLLSRQNISYHHGYDARRNVIFAIREDGAIVERKYNAFNQIVEEAISDAYGTYNISYTYDRKGRITSVKLPDDSKIIYLYDALYGREVQRFSSKGEMLYFHQYTHYDTMGRLLVENLMGQGGLRKHFYNLKGEKVGTENDFFIEKIRRDVFGRIKEVDYHPLGRIFTHKRSKEETATLFRCLYIGDYHIGSLNEKGEIKELRIPGICGDKLSLESIAIEKNGEYFIPLFLFLNLGKCASIDPA